jgi:hypothetical protein
MGSWNGTCGVTQFPITEGEKVKLILLIEHDGARMSGKLNPIGCGVTYHNDLWTPVMYPISGCYDDYGGIDNIEEDDNTRNIISFFTDRKKEITYSPSHNETHDLNTIQGIIKAVSRGYLTFRSIYTGNQVNISFMLINFDVFKNCIKVIEENPDNLTHRLLKRIEDGSIQQFDPEVVTENFLAKHQNREPRPHSKLICTFAATGEFKHFASHDLTFKATKDLEKLAIQAFYFDEFLSNFRKLYSPQSGAGSQYCDLDEQIKFHKLCGKTLSKMKKADELLRLD